MSAHATAPDARPDWLADPTLLAAFWRYERALMTNDTAELDALFAADPTTTRCEGGSALVGHDAISAFRATRPPVAQRYLRRVHVRRIDDDAAVIVAESVRRDGGSGSQTQLWQRTGPGAAWAVTVAHVSTVPGVQFSAPALTGAEERAIWATPAERRPLIESVPYGPGASQPGALSGIRIAVKDLFAIAGETIGAGNPTFAASRAPETTTAPAVQALIDAGAEITGLAQTDELAFSIAGTNIHYGTPPNPAAPGHISGGSTSGPAAAVALGLADLALGTDTAGSIRVPGSYSALFGLRPTHDAVSRAGLVGLAPSFDSVGVLARDIRTLTLGAEALLAGAPGPDASPGATGTLAASAQQPRAQRITTLLIAPTIVALADPETHLSFEASVRALALNAGVDVAEVAPGAGVTAEYLEQWFAAFRVAQQYEAWAEDAAFVTANPGALDPAIAERFAAAAQLTDAEASDARHTLARATAALEALITPGTALALPSTSSVAPSLTATPAEIDRTRGATLRLTCLASLSGLPALTLPYGRVGTLPIGLCLIGPRHADRALLALATPRD